jgi:ABC-2 type transport system permease protein
MRATLSLIRREFTAFFLSPIAYVALAVFLLVTGQLFALAMSQLNETWGDGVEFPMQTMLGDPKFWLMFLFIPPLLTMRLLAEERGTGTLEALLTAPIRDWQVVVAKFTSTFGFYIILWLPTLLYLPILLDLHAVWQAVFTPFSIIMLVGLGVIVLAFVLGVFGASGGVSFGLAFIGLIGAVGGGVMHFREAAPHLVEVTAGIDPYPVLTSYLGVLLVGAMFLAMGLFVSSLVKNQLVAALYAMLISLPLIAGAFWRPDRESGTWLYRLEKFISVPEHFRQDFTRGVLDSRPMVLYATVTLLCLFLTVRSLEARRR